MLYNGGLAGKALSFIFNMGDPQRLFRISDGSKTTSDWWKKNAVPSKNKKGITHSLNTIER